VADDVAQGAAFAADWSELRSVTRNRLVGRVLPPDLASAVEAANAAAASAGAFGVGTTRYLQDIQEGDPNLPVGARLVNVSIQLAQAVASASPRMAQPQIMCKSALLVTSTGTAAAPCCGQGLKCVPCWCPLCCCACR
jgi:hypothetical protein